MNITRLNFNELFPQILKTVSEAHFIALDLEMSGLISSTIYDPSMTDTMQVRYEKSRHKVKKYIPTQLGLCPIKIGEKVVEYFPYNFYIYPLAIGEKGAEEFVFNSESMRFLAKNQFDFNKMFYEGVPFLNSKKIQSRIENIAKMNERESKNKDYLIKSPDIAAFLNMKLEEVSSWVSSENNNEILVDIQFVRVKAYQILMSLIENKYPSLALTFVYLDSNKNVLSDDNTLARKFIKIMKCPPENQSSLKIDKNEIKNEEIKESMKLNEIWETISNKKIPLIVHNGFTDLLHIYHRFIDDLPVKEEDFKSKFHETFSTVYDTKYICNNNPVLFNKVKKQTNLENCFETFLKDSKEKNDESSSKIAEHFEYYTFSSENTHEAGFDSLMTAFTFIEEMKNLHYPFSKMMTEEFKKNTQYYSNKVPLGNIRMPYNYAERTEEFTEDSGIQIYFRCLVNKSEEKQSISLIQKEEEITKSIMKLYGPVQLFWEDKEKLNFSISFLREEEGRRFIKENVDEYGFGFYNMADENRYLISTEAPIKRKLE